MQNEDQTTLLIMVMEQGGFYWGNQWEITRNQKLEEESFDQLLEFLHTHLSGHVLYISKDYSQEATSPLYQT